MVIFPVSCCYGNIAYVACLQFCGTACFCGRDSATDPTRGAYSAPLYAPPDSLLDLGGGKGLKSGSKAQGKEGNGREAKKEEEKGRGRKMGKEGREDPHISPARRPSSGISFYIPVYRVIGF